MALIDTVSATRVTVPQFMVGKPNGKLDASILRAPDGSTSMNKKMFEPVSYAMQALSIASKGISERSVGRYRTYAEQESLFRSRYTTDYLAGRPYKMWNGKRWYQRPDTAMAATPGASNHGLGLADDVAEERDGDSGAESMSDAQLTWMRDNARAYGFGLETRKERWHWHWVGGNALSQVVVDTLYRAGINVPDLSRYGFTVPKPSAATSAPLPAPSDGDLIDAAPPATLQINQSDNPDTRTRTRWLQQILNERFGGQLSVDGFFGETTKAGVQRMQQIIGASSDGQYGPRTATALSLWLGAH